MPSRRVDWLINSMTEREYRAAKEAYDSFHPEAGSMSFDEYTEEPEFEEEFEEELKEATSGSGARNFGGFGRSHYVGSRMPYDGSRMAPTREHRGGHASGSSHGHGNLQRSGKGGGYEARNDYELFAEMSGGVRAERGRGGPGPSLPSEASNPHGPGFSATGGNRPCCGAPPPPSRSAIFSNTRLGRVSDFFDNGSHSRGDQQDSHSHGGSTDRDGGRRNPANDRRS